MRGRGWFQGVGWAERKKGKRWKKKGIKRQHTPSMESSWKERKDQNPRGGETAKLGIKGTPKKGDHHRPAGMKKNSQGGTRHTLL